jgi:S-adenosylmethionine-diacylglycerol 3-amino-3-carboxypropyl transferase
MGPDVFRATTEELVSRSAPGAMYAYYNMMLPRKLTDAMPEAFVRQTELADRLFANNQAFFYGAYHVDILHS